MRSQAFSVLILGFLLVLSAPALAQAPPVPPVKVTLAPKAPTVGDHVRATITVQVRTADLAADPRFPVWGKSWGDAEVVGRSEPKKVSEQNGVASWEQTIDVAAFKPGIVPLTPVAIALPLKTGTVQAATPANLAMAVRSVIPQTEKDPKPKPAAPPRPLPLGSRFWWTLAGLGACCLAAWAFLWRRSRRTRTAEAPALPPLAELVAELERLRAEPSMLALHTRLSFALRRYLGRRLPFPAVESTTSDVSRQLLSRRMPPPLTRQTVDLLRACDLVKFARQDVGEHLGHERAEAARRLAGDWEALFAPVAAEPAEPETTLEKAG